MGPAGDPDPEEERSPGGEARLTPVVTPVVLITFRGGILHLNTFGQSLSAGSVVSDGKR